MTTDADGGGGDNAAASLPRPCVLDAAFADQLRSAGASAGEMARIQAQYLTRDRRDAADFLHCDPDEIALVRSTSQAPGTLACSPFAGGQRAGLRPGIPGLHGLLAPPGGGDRL